MSQPREYSEPDRRDQGRNGGPTVPPPQYESYQQPQYQQPGPGFTSQPQYLPPWQQQYQQAPPQQPRYPPYQPQYAPPPRQRRSRKGLAAIGCLGFGGLVVVIAAVAASHPSSSSSAPAAGPLQTLATVVPASAAAPASSAAPAKPTTVATFTGSGTEKTATFTVGATWRLDYSFNCSSFGYKGNFVVPTDGGSDFNGVMVNDLAMSKTAYTYAYNDAGTHYLEVNSECSWVMRVASIG